MKAIKIPWIPIKHITKTGTKNTVQTTLDSYSGKTAKQPRQFLRTWICKISNHPCAKKKPLFMANFVWSSFCKHMVVCKENCLHVHDILWLYWHCTQNIVEGPFNKSFQLLTLNLHSIYMSCNQHQGTYLSCFLWDNLQ